MTNSNQQKFASVDTHQGISALRRAKGAVAHRTPSKVHTNGVPANTETVTPVTPNTEGTPQQVESPQVQPLATDSVMGVATESTQSNINNPTQSTDEGSKTTSEDGTNWEKRYADARRYESQLKDEITNLKKQLTEVTKEKVVIPKTDAELDAWKKDHPEMYDTVLTLIRKEGQVLNQELETAKQELDKVKQHNKKEALFAEVLKHHRDADEIRHSAQFKNWFNTQSSGVQQLFKSTELEDIVQGISFYKNSVGITSQAKESKQQQDTFDPKSAEAAGVVSTTTSPPNMPTPPKQWTNQEIKALTPEQYAAKREEIKAFQRDQRRGALANR